MNKIATTWPVCIKTTLRLLLISANLTRKKIFELMIWVLGDVTGKGLSSVKLKEMILRLFHNQGDVMGPCTH